MSSPSLLSQRRFLPLFITQFLGAFNDNVYKNAVVLLLNFGAAAALRNEAETGLLTNLAAALLILPFFLFSPIAGQLADKYDKAQLFRVVKFMEIVVMLIASLGFYLGDMTLLMACIFLMGTQSAFFGPAKYSILPQHLDETELTKGNGLIEMSTLIAIVLGLIYSGPLVHQELFLLIALSVITVAILGFVSSTAIPSAPSRCPDMKISWNFFAQTRDLYRLARRVESVHLSILGNSWFWFVGAVVISVMPTYAKFFVGGDANLATALLVTFVIGTSLGAGFCILFSRGEIELGLVPIGAFGLTIFGLDLYFIDYSVFAGKTLGIGDFFMTEGWSKYRILIDLTMLGSFASVYVIPLNALIQVRSEESVRSRVIAANNIFNAIFMVVSAVLTMVQYKLGMNTLEIFLMLFIMNALVATYIFSVIPEFAMRFVDWLLASTIYRIRYEGRDHFPRHGPVLIVANHVSYIDWFILTAACRRPARFVMYHKHFKIPVVNMIFKLAKAIPIAPEKEDPEYKRRAFERISEELRAGQVVCIFPEGMITEDGELCGFRPGVEEVLRRDPVPVIPVALDGLWGSFFSRKKGSAMKGLPRPSYRKIHVRVGEPLPPETTAAQMEERVAALLGRD